MRRLSSRTGLVLLIVATGVVAVVPTAAARPTAAPTVTIGWAFDSKGAMAPSDNPAPAAARIEVNQWNASSAGGFKLVIKTCDTQGNKPAIAKACALKLIGQ